MVSYTIWHSLKSRKSPTCETVTYMLLLNFLDLTVHKTEDGFKYDMLKRNSHVHIHTQFFATQSNVIPEQQIKHMAVQWRRATKDCNVAGKMIKSIRTTRTNSKGTPEKQNTESKNQQPFQPAPKRRTAVPSRTVKNEFITGGLKDIT